MTSSASTNKSAATSDEGQSGDTATPQRVPSRLRFALLTLIGVYPVITAILYVVLPLARSWQIWQTTLLVAPLMVMIMVFWMIPFIQKRFAGFIMIAAGK